MQLFSKALIAVAKFFWSPISLSFGDQNMSSVLPCIFLIL